MELKSTQNTAAEGQSSARATNRQSLAFEILSSFLSQDAVNAPIAQVTPPRTALSSAPNSKPLTTLISALSVGLGPGSVFSAKVRSATTLHSRHLSSSCRPIRRTPTSRLSDSPAFAHPRDGGASLDGLFPPSTTAWEGMTLQSFPESLTANNNATSHA